jgi:hypothetical protein
LDTGDLIENRGTGRKARSHSFYPLTMYDRSDDNAQPETEGNVENVMHEYKEGKLKSGSGRKVKSRKQAIAIAMSESGQSKRRKKAS